MAVREQYALVHAGARHKGEFSRYDFQRNKGANGIAAVTKFTATLPPSARAISFTDHIGNISNSKVCNCFPTVYRYLEKISPL